MVEMSTYGSERARAGNRPGYSSQFASQRERTARAQSGPEQFFLVNRRMVRDHVIPLS